MPPCLVLQALQADLTSLAKSKNLPLTRIYPLAQDAVIELHLWKQDKGDFHLEVKRNNGQAEWTDPKLKRLVDSAHLYIWRALSSYLARIDVPPCPEMAHSGADEILALYQAIDAFKNNSDLPFETSANGPRGRYQLFSATRKNALCQIVIETNHIYGNSMKWIIEVEFIDQAIERAEKILADALVEWLRPGGASLKVEYEREQRYRAKLV